MRTWLRKHPDGTERIDPDELHNKAEETLDLVQSQQPRVNLITAYLERRKNQNGFGEDFEFTLRPKGV